MEAEEKVLNIRISVRDLVEFILRSGDIDNRKGGGLGEKEAMQEGSRIHRKIQGRMGSAYRAEVPIGITLLGDGYKKAVQMGFLQNRIRYGSMRSRACIGIRIP